MKRFFKLLILAIILCLPVVAKADTKANVYLFRGEGCPHCENAINFFNSLSTDEEYKDYFSLVQYEVWYDEDNEGILKEVAKELDTTVSGVPFIVIGDKYFSGYGETYNDQIKEAIKENYQRIIPKDVVLTAEVKYKLEKATEALKEKTDTTISDTIGESNDEYKTTDEIIDDYVSDYSSLSDTDQAALLALFSFVPVIITSGINLVIIIVGFIVTLFFMLIRIVLLWKIFKKAGRPGWAALIPIYNNWVFFEISGLPGWLSLIGFVPFVSSLAIKVIRIVCYFMLVKKFNKEWWFGLILIFVELIGLAIIAFDKSEYVFEETNTNNAKDAKYKEAPKKEIAEVKEEKKEE